MKIFICLILLLPFSITAKDLNLKISKNVLNTSHIKYIPHHGSGRFGTYVSMEIPFKPISKVFSQLIHHLRSQLTSRGEAHITLITPTEFNDILKKNISIKEIDNIVKSKIQKSIFKILCLGRGEARLNSKTEETYFLVLESKDLLQLRREVHKAFIKNGGDENAFVPKKYNPHITLGFSRRDLHESDGIIKNIKSCYSNVKVVNSF